MIYFIQEDGNKNAPIKIGFTSGEPSSRLASLQTGHPTRLRLLRICDGGIDYERELHVRFNHLRLHGEWFKADPALHEFMESLTDPRAEPSRSKSGPRLVEAGESDTESGQRKWKHVPLECCICGADILADMKVCGNIEWRCDSTGIITHVWSRHKTCPMSRETGWEDLGDLCNPYVFIDFWMTLMNGIQSGKQKVADKAYEDAKTILLALVPYVFRPMTSEEMSRVSRLRDLPRAFGGLG